MTFLTVTGMSKRYGKVVALDDVTIEVPAGSRTAVVGSSGSGKTTLLRLIAGFEVPDTGRVTLDGSVLANGPSVVPAHRRSIGIVAQHGALFPHLTVSDNIGFGLERNTPLRDKRILALMDLVELAPAMRDRRPHQLSGGQQQRVALARALARQPKLMLFDEPFSALDAGLREGIRTSVAEVLRTQNITAILVTHDQAEALSFADQVAILREGKLLQVGSPEDLYMNPRDPYTAAFLGDVIIMDAKLNDGWAVCPLGRIESSSLHSGPAKIMLRPEQVVLSPVSADAKDDSGFYGNIVRTEFGGASCSIAISLASRSHDTLDKPLLVIKTTSINLPAVGSRVQIVVLGKAHVFE
ncbi:iron(III) transport system ATP-binding protein [Phyllobacterium sp. 1468]|uniref:ABC transporter ATP-binding protein n=1 Tax=Phyllobacterium sp. 1468 TaxID=2817759 RepID=UPI00285610AF|nr:ABC transporter ATP-binding protein [Phyllobacterium sp. 1468]MDR6632667.1 iron(III) transport system ATP-binding protein [Phyllobacterium sp. 1468]